MCIQQTIKQKITSKLPLYQNNTSPRPILSQKEGYIDVKSSSYHLQGLLLKQMKNQNKEYLTEKQDKQFLNNFKNKFLYCEENNTQCIRERIIKKAKFLKASNDKKYQKNQKLQILDNHSRDIKQFRRYHERNTQESIGKVQTVCQTTREYNPIEVYHMNAGTGQIQRKFPKKLLFKNAEKNRKNNQDQSLQISQNKASKNPAIIMKRQESYYGQISQRKSSIKQKIKDRIKGQIKNIIKKGSFVVHNEQKERQSIKNKVCFRSGIIKEPRLLKNWSEIQRYQKKLSNLDQNIQVRRIHNKDERRLILLSQIPFTARKAKSSLCDRASNKIQYPKKLRKNSNYDEYESNNGHYKYCNYKRSMSTGIRTKNYKNLKTNILKAGSERMPNEEEIQPWLISQNEEDEGF